MDFDCVALNKNLSIVFYIKCILFEILSNKIGPDLYSLRDISLQKSIEKGHGTYRLGTSHLSNSRLHEKTSLKLAMIEDINIEVLDKTIIIGDINLIFSPVKSDYELSCCYFLVNSATHQNEKTIQIGLDNPYLARRLHHKAIHCTVKEDSTDHTWAIHVHVNHGKGNFDRESILNSMKLNIFLTTMLARDKLDYIDSIKPFFINGNTIEAQDLNDEVKLLRLRQKESKIRAMSEVPDKKLPVCLS